MVGGPSLFHPDQIKTQTGGTYGVYTPFVRNCLARAAPNPPVSATTRIPAPALWPRSEELAAWNLCPRRPDWAAGWDNLWQPGEPGAIAALQRFKVRAIQHYDTDRDRPDRLGTSRLSAHLHWGEISPNQLWYATQGADKFQAEILWREFALYLLWHRPELPDRCLRPEFERFGWRDDPPALAAWQQGRTGFPIVDAGMRELWQTGFMHNRVRMIVASFLTKHLLLPWQQGAAWFMETLLDADLAANAANWQWAAGCGVEAQPFFRIFNPVIQGRKFDPDGVYVRRFVPELRGQAGAAAYPPPLVDLAAARARALAEFARLR